MRNLTLAAAALVLSAPAAAQDGSEMTASRTPENAVKFLNALASQKKVSLFSNTAVFREVSWDVVCGGGECSLGSPKTRVVEDPFASSNFQLGELSACKSKLSITNENAKYKNNILEEKFEGRVHTMAFRNYTIKIPGTIIYNDWVSALRALENFDFDWGQVQKVTLEHPNPYWYYLRLANSAAPGGGIRLFFGDNEEVAKRAQLAIDVIVKSCDPLADSGF